MRTPSSFLMAAMFAATSVAAWAENNQTQAKGQSFPVTIGQAAPNDAHRNGPLFSVVASSVSDLRPILSDDVLMTFSDRSELLGTEAVLSAVGKIESDCDGPYSLDEGLQRTIVGDSWVQVAWVCDTSPDVSVREFLKFEQSPEISVSFEFKDGKVGLVSVIEQFPMPPLWRVLPMDAYQRVKGNPNG